MIGGVVQKGHIFMVLVMVVGLMVSCGWYVFAASVRAVWGVYRCWVQLVAWWAIKRRIGHVYSMVRLGGSSSRVCRAYQPISGLVARHASSSA